MIAITFVIPSSLDYNGGIEKTVARYNAFDAQNFKKIVLQCVPGGNNKNVYGINSVYSKLIIGTSGKLNFIVRAMAPLILKFDRAMNYKIIKNIEKNSDIVYLTNDDYYYLFRHAGFYVWSEHGNIPSNYTGVALLNEAIYALIKNNLIFRKIKAMHLINCYNRDIVPFKKTFCVPNGVDTTLFFPAERKNKVIKLLFVGRLEKSKGIDKIINVFKNHILNMELTVVGSGELESLFIGTAKNINYVKNPDNDTLAEIYRNSDAFIFPSVLENFGNVVLEALSCGLYVIASNTLKPRFDDIESMNFLEYIESSDDAILKSLEDIGKKIEYTGKYENRIAMHDYISQKYGWDTILEKFYNEMKTIYSEK
jgi:glycosyltransferase involved in cell wall biosynthesis